MVRAALSGALDDVPTETDPIFGLAIPTSCPGVPSRFLRPRETWDDAEAYDRQARQLGSMFTENFRTYAGQVPKAVASAGPRLD
jgi:phosphoenolpyruvate carboxykinase (ATP)